MPNLTTLKTHIDDLNTAWSEFKHTNEDRLSEIEKKGHADSLYQEKIERLNQEIDTRLSALETANQRSIGISAEAAQPPCEHKQALHEYLRKGNEQALEQLEIKSLSTSVNADGGYTVHPQLEHRIGEILTLNNPMRELARVQTISTNRLDIIQDEGTAAYGWASESGARTDTANPKFNKLSIPTHELYAQPKATQSFLDDSSVDVDEWLASHIASAFANAESDAFINGDGTGKPKGILSYPDGVGHDKVKVEETFTSALFTVDDALRFTYELNSPYIENAYLLMNRKNIASLRMGKDTDGQYIWQPAVSLTEPERINGIPLKATPDMVGTQAKGDIVMAIGDFKQAYTIVDHITTRLLRDPYTTKPFIKFYTVKRIGGALTNGNALKLLKVKTG